MKSLIKIRFYLFNLLLCLCLNVSAALECSSYLSYLSSKDLVTSKLSIQDLKEKGIKPYIGIAVRLTDKRMVLAIGSYFGNSHRSLLMGLQRRYKGRVVDFLWGGELLLAVNNVSDFKLIYAANETSGFLQSLNLYQNGYFDFHKLEVDKSDIQSVIAHQSDLGSLMKFKDTAGLNFFESFEAIKYSEDKKHLLPELNYNQINQRHAYNNNLSAVIMWFHVLSKGREAKMSFQQMADILKTLVIWTRYALIFKSYNSDLQFEKDMNYFLKIAQEFISDAESFKSFDSYTFEKWEQLEKLSHRATRFSLSHKGDSILYEYIK